METSPLVSWWLGFSARTTTHINKVFINGNPFRLFLKNSTRIKFFNIHLKSTVMEQDSKGTKNGKKRHCSVSVRNNGFFGSQGKSTAHRLLGLYEIFTVFITTGRGNNRAWQPIYRDNIRQTGCIDECISEDPLKGKRSPPVVPIAVHEHVMVTVSFSHRYLRWTT